MVNFIKNIFENKIDEVTHQKFTRFGLGEYERALMSIKTGKDLKIKASYDLSDDLFATIAQNIKENAEVSGKIIAPRDFKKEFNFEVKSFSRRGSLYTAELKTTLKPEQLKEIYTKFKLDFILLSIKSKSFILKCKNSLPKPGSALKGDFCSASLPINLLPEFTFDIKQDFKEAKIKHIFKITNIEIPKEYQKDFTRARLMAKRKGALIREIEIDGKKEIKEIQFKV